MRSRFATVVLAAIMLAPPAAAQAHFTFVNGGSVTAFGYAVGPYNGLQAMGNSNQPVLLNCVDFFHGISQGQEFDANLTSVAGTSGFGSNTRNSNVNLYRQAAYLSTLYSTAGINSQDIGNIQATIWNLFAPTGLAMAQTWEGATHAPSYWTSLTNANYATMNFSGYYVVTDVNKNIGGVQEFVMYNPNIGSNTTSTPEPASLVLMGTGLLGIAALRRRQKTLAG